MKLTHPDTSPPQMPASPYFLQSAPMEKMQQIVDRPDTFPQYPPRTDNRQTKPTMTTNQRKEGYSFEQPGEIRLYGKFLGGVYLNTTYYPNQELLADYQPESIEGMFWMPSQGDNWHQGWYGLGVEDGTIVYVDCDSDGNWETDGAGELATAANYNAEWERLASQAEEASAHYDTFCLETGTDPLGAYFVKTSTKRNENYIAYATPWIGAPEHGMAVTAIRGAKSHLGGNEVITPDEAPRHLSEFLGLKKVGDRYCMEDIKTRADICDSCVGCVGDHGPNGELYIKFQVERVRPRRGSLIRDDIRRIARAAIDRRTRKAS